MHPRQPGDSAPRDDGKAPTCEVDGAVSAPVPLAGIDLGVAEPG